MPQTQEFLSPPSGEIVLADYAINLVLTLVLSVLLAAVYCRYGQALSNRRRFASNFPVLGLTTMIVITVVKSSLALSLGLVGALSIVRFRAAIKDPEELAFLFVTIAIGLGMGAGQRIITLVGFGVIVLAALLRHRAAARDSRAKDVYLTVSSTSGSPMPLDQVSEILGQNCRAVDLKRFDEGGGGSEAVFIVEFADLGGFERARTALHGLDGSTRLGFLDQNLA